MDRGEVCQACGRTDKLVGEGEAQAGELVNTGEVWAGELLRSCSVALPGW